MDPDHFDTLTRSLTDARSRRGALATLVGSTLGMLGLSDTTGKKGKKKKGKKKKKKKKRTPPQTAPPPGCGTGAACAAGQICAQGQCVTGQGTCAAGASSCPGSTVNCNGSTACKCFRSASGATRCGMIPAGIQCGQCSTDEQCDGFVPGAFCVTETAPGTNCSCGTAGQGFCIIPCDDRCAGVGCPPPDQCHDPGVCDPETGRCSNPEKADATPCNDGNVCTQTDTCQDGSCQGTPVTCTAPEAQCCPAGTANAGTCGRSGGSITCTANTECCSNECQNGVGCCPTCPTGCSCARLQSGHMMVCAKSVAPFGSLAPCTTVCANMEEVCIGDGDPNFGGLCFMSCQEVS